MGDVTNGGLPSQRVIRAIIAKETRKVHCAETLEYLIQSAFHPRITARMGLRRVPTMMEDKKQDDKYNKVEKLSPT